VWPLFTHVCVCVCVGKVRADKYWQGPDNRRYRSFKQIETANAGIQYCRDTFLKGVQAEINSLTNRMRAHDPTLVDTTPRAPTSRSRSNSLHTSHNSTPQPAPPRPVAPPSSSAAHAHGTRARSCSLPSSMLLNNNNNNSNKNNALPRSPAAASTASSVPYNADDHPLHLAPALLNTLVPHPKTIHGRCYVIRHPNRTPDTCLAFEFHPDPDLHPNDQQPRTVTEEAAWGAAIAVELIFQRNTGIPGQISTAQVSCKACERPADECEYGEAEITLFTHVWSRFRLLAASRDANETARRANQYRPRGSKRATSGSKRATSGSEQPALNELL